MTTTLYESLFWVSLGAVLTMLVHRFFIEPTANLSKTLADVDNEFDGKNPDGTKRIRDDVL